MKDKINKIENLKIDLPPEIKDWIEEQAESRGISEEQFINQVLNDYVSNSGDKRTELGTDIEDEESNYKNIIDELLDIIRKF